MTIERPIRILRMKALSEKIGYQPSTIYGLIAQGKFPKPTKIVPGGRAAGWVEDQIDIWINERNFYEVVLPDLTDKSEAEI